MISILVTEDSEIIQKATQLLFKSFECTVDFANSGKETLDALNQKNYDIVFLDLGLPDMTGLELAKKIRENPKLSELRLIALTAHSSAKLKQDCERVGIREFYTKPLSEKDILTILRT